MRASDQIALKLDLERRFLPGVKALFNAIKADFRIGIATAKRTRAATYQGQWEGLLTTHYKRVQKAFMGAVTGPQKQNEDEDDLKDEILAALLLWVERYAPRQSNMITETTQKNMDDALAQARQAFSDEGRTDYTTRELATVAAVMLGRKFMARMPGIISLETQAPAEATKLIEFYADSGLPADAVVSGQAVAQTGNYKQWITMRDERVRAAHREADGQTIPVEQAFSVGGERLMFPGDASLGATIGNLINCRCVVVYFKRV